MNAPDDTGEGRDAPRSGATIRGVRADGTRPHDDLVSTSPWLEDPGDTDHDDTDLDDAELDDDLEADEELVLRLRSLLDPSEDLTTRTQVDVDRALRGRSVLATGFELLGLGVATVRTLLSHPPEPADREPGGL